MEKHFDSPEALINSLKHCSYILNHQLAVSLYLSLARGKPLFLEGEAGVGKTEIAKTLSIALKKPLIRLQCYEGLDINQAAYEWNYGRQLIAIQNGNRNESDLFSRDYLIERPLLKAIEGDDKGNNILLIDELDRADEAFEAYLLEILSDWQISIPELGTIETKTPPIVIITSNRTREIHDALKRRCYYHWVGFPNKETELEIISMRVPEAANDLQKQVVAFVQNLREKNLYKSPGIAETIDWAQALVELNCVALDPQTIDSTIGVLLKYQDDISKIQGSEAGKIFNEIMIERKLIDKEEE
jgi:MoxR-like ATPase